MLQQKIKNKPFVLQEGLVLGHIYMIVSVRAVFALTSHLSRNSFVITFDHPWGRHGYLLGLYNIGG